MVGANERLLQGLGRYTRGCGGSEAQMRCCHHFCHHLFEKELTRYQSWDSCRRLGIGVGWPCKAKRTACGAVLVLNLFSILAGILVMNIPPLALHTATTVRANSSSLHLYHNCVYSRSPAHLGERMDSTDRREGMDSTNGFIQW
jgi:hypothetical protein